MQTIRDTIPHAKGIEELSRARFDVNQKCNRAQMVESGLMGGFWHRAMVYAKVREIIDCHVS